MEDTGRKLKIAANHLTRVFDRFASEFGLTSMQMSIIDFLVRNKHKVIFQHEIEYEFNIQRSTTSVLLQRMEKNDLILRKKSADDARQKSIHLTDKSQEIANEISAYMQAHQAAIEETFTMEELANFHKILDFFIQQKE